ncbi:MAG: hypothetical protein Harvfovirus39_2 [Harvfovirus sp.]|uniref:Uncharacterized protein n=1 Tax=Harvfovirus sp. TaxID=2487768 RepID=A0A3G5A6Q1_9VIRU|nr:MAG: hypothetical protein Harvfovirus39_2 [Harvfovirus sp.]
MNGWVLFSVFAKVFLLDGVLILTFIATIISESTNCLAERNYLTRFIIRYLWAYAFTVSYYGIMVNGYITNPIAKLFNLIINFGFFAQINYCRANVFNSSPFFTVVGIISIGFGLIRMGNYCLKKLNNYGKIDLNK